MNSIRKINNCCALCTKRSIYCHSFCKDFLAQTEKLKTRKEKINLAKKEYYESVELVRVNATKFKKKKRRY